MPAASPWWHGAVLYQLYVRSWRDSGGDGYGDLPGIIERLEHLSWLGVDGIWLSPTMPSPDDDWGYDVSDYTGVHPELGTLADLDALIEQAGRLGIKVLLDLVPNHTSSAHPWFVDAVSGSQAGHRDYYVWADAQPDGGPPNNWLDSTGQCAWQLDETSGQFYLHNFLASQPDLNWWNPAVHAEFEQILAFWFDRGVAGFRIDVAHGLYKDAQLRDNPASGEDSELRGRFGLLQKYNANQPEVHGVYRDWRAIAEKATPERLLLGETWVAEPEKLRPFYGDGDELQLAFNFPFALSGFTAAELATVVGQTLAALPDGACPVWTASNHDIGRFPTRWCGDDPRQARLALLILATLPGTSVLYYGDEIGMADEPVPLARQRDAMTLGGNERRPNRDRARTPLRWDDSADGGFAPAGAQPPWLPFGAGVAGSVASQRADPSSTLSFCRSLLALRRAELAPGIASYTQREAPAGQWSYQVGGLIVHVNLTGEPAAVDGLPREILLATPGTIAPDIGNVVLPPWSGVIAAAPAR